MHFFFAIGRALVVFILCICSVQAQTTSTVRNWNEERVSFWLKVYTVYDSAHTVLHDSAYPHIIYEVFKFGHEGENDLDKRSTIVSAAKDKYRAILKTLDSGKVFYHEMTPEQWRIYNLFKPLNQPHKYRKALKSSRMRLQDGRADLFLEGLKRAGTYMDEIKQVFSACGMPQQLVALTFAESLFYTKALSKVGAAGLWQLMPATAREFLQVGKDVDERLDPILATMAACKILKRNFSKLDGSWPLAITAYNHGLGGMLRAKKRHGTENLEEFIRSYESNSFKFASKNFYAQYLAAYEAFNNAERYFGKFDRHPKVIYGRVRVPYAIMFKDLSNIIGVPAPMIEELNPSLTRRVLTSKLPVPEGYPLRVPAGVATASVEGLRMAEEALGKAKVVKRGRRYAPTPLIFN